jgi:hypothetical protein
MCHWRIKREDTPNNFVVFDPDWDDQSPYGDDIEAMTQEQADTCVNAVTAHMDALRAADETHRCFGADYIAPGG